MARAPRVLDQRIRKEGKPVDGAVDLAGEQRVVQHVAAGDAVPLHGDVAQAGLLGAALDGALVLGDGEWQVGHAVLDAHADGGGLGAGGSGQGERGGELQQGAAGDGHGGSGQAASSAGASAGLPSRRSAAFSPIISVVA